MYNAKTILYCGKKYKPCSEQQNEESKTPMLMFLIRGNDNPKENLKKKDNPKKEKKIHKARQKISFNCSSMHPLIMCYLYILYTTVLALFVQICSCKLLATHLKTSINMWRVMRFQVILLSSFLVLFVFFSRVFNTSIKVIKIIKRLQIYFWCQSQVSSLQNWLEGLVNCGHIQ